MSGTTPKADYIMQGFRAYQEYIKTEVEAGRLDKAEAVAMIFSRAAEILADLRMPEPTYIHQEFGYSN